MLNYNCVQGGMRETLDSLDQFCLSFMILKIRVLRDQEIWSRWENPIVKKCAVLWITQLNTFI